MRPSRLNVATAAFAIVIVAIYYWRFTNISLSTGFGQDDLMNLYFAWREPFLEVLKANLFFRTPIVRPFGALVYVSSLQLWGYDGFPLRVICYAVLWLNLPVTYFFVRRLTGSREIAISAVLLHCVHSCYFPMYYGSGSLYDVFSFFFYYAALVLALRARAEERLLSGLECVGLAILFAWAVNSKEAAASLPAMLLLYELLYRGFPRSISWVWREARGVLVTGGVALVFLWARFTGPNNLLGHPDYTPVFTLQRYLECTAHYLDELSARANLWTPEKAGLLLGGMAAVAIVARSRHLIFAWFLVVLGAAPMAFVSPRGLSAYYIPVLGYAIFLAVMLVGGREFAARILRLRPLASVASQALLFLALVAGLWEWQVSTERSFPDHWADLRRIESAAAQFRSHPEWFRPGASLLILNDPFGEYEWATTFIAAVVGNDRTVTIQKRKMDQPIPGPEQMAQFRTVIAYANGGYYEADRATQRH